MRNDTNNVPVTLSELLLAVFRNRLEQAEIEYELIRSILQDHDTLLH